MDQELRFREIIKRGLSGYRERSNRGGARPIEAMCAFDDEAGQYLLVRVGWSGKRRFRQIVLHVHLCNGKVWIETDETEEGFATELIQAGIPQSDIVLAFHPEHLRSMTDFAVA